MAFLYATKKPTQERRKVMYQVILRHDKGREYYHDYFINDEMIGTIQCDELPPYQDIIKARSCYYDDGKWVFDDEKYEELSYAQIGTPDNTELSEGLMDLAMVVDELITSVTTIADNIDIVTVLEQLVNKVAKIKGE